MSDAEPYTRIPNALLDGMAQLGNAELRVLLAIVRRTAGWQKECDVISLTQLETMTGLGRRHVIQALRELKERRLIEHTPAKRNGRCYRLVTLGNQSPTGTSDLGLPELVTLGNQSSPRLVTLGNTQKKDSKERIKKERETRAPAQVNLDSLHEGVAIFKRLTGKRSVPPAIVTAIAEKITDCPRFETAATAWIKAGYKPDNLTGIFDWYDHPEKMERRNGTYPTGRHAAAAAGKPVPERRDNLKRDDTS